jgi:hypothetical protein
VLRKCVATHAGIETGRAALNEKHHYFGIALRGAAAREEQEDERQEHTAMQRK